MASESQKMALTICWGKVQISGECVSFFRYRDVWYTKEDEADEAYEAYMKPR